MSQSLFDASVSSILRSLGNLDHCLELAAQHAEANKIDPAVLLASRLYPDMFALTRQVQIVSDNAKGCVARLTATEAPKYADTEATFAELRARLQKTIDYVKGATAQQFSGSDTRPIEVKFPNQTLNFKDGWDYLLSFALPNIAFHFTTAYAILRHNGVKLGKGDYLGQVGRG